MYHCVQAGAAMANAGAPELCDFEKERLIRIAANNARLAALGIPDAMEQVKKLAQA